MQNFYLVSVTGIFVLAMVLQIPSLGINDNVKIFTFVCWAAYGVVPTFHWANSLGWFESPVVAVSNFFILINIIFMGTFL